MAEAKTRGPLFWVILGVVALLAILGVVLVTIGYYGNTEKKPEMVSTSNSGYVALKLMIAASPDLEVIREEPEKSQILVREKKSGEYFIHRADDEAKAIVRIPVPADQVK